MVRWFEMIAWHLSSSVLMAGVLNFYANEKEALDKIEFQLKKVPDWDILPHSD